MCLFLCPLCSSSWCRTWICHILSFCLPCWRFCIILAGCHGFLDWRMDYQANAFCETYLLGLQANQCCYFSWQGYFFLPKYVCIIVGGMFHYFWDIHVLDVYVDVFIKESKFYQKSMLSFVTFKSYARSWLASAFILETKILTHWVDYDSFVESFCFM